MFEDYDTQNTQMYYESFVRTNKSRHKSIYSSHSVYSDRDYEDMRGMEDQGEYDYPYRGE